MKLTTIPRFFVTWMSWLDKFICSGKSCTNPYLVTFIYYMYMLMGCYRGLVSHSEIFRTFDDVYAFMSAQAAGLWVLCLIFAMSESIALCPTVFDIVMRFLVVVVISIIFYMTGLLLPWFAAGLLALVCVMYVLHVADVVRDTLVHRRAA